MTVHQFGQRGHSIAAGLEGAPVISREASHAAQLLWAPSPLVTARSMLPSERLHGCCAPNPQDVCWANICACGRHLRNGGAEC